MPGLPDALVMLLMKRAVILEIKQLAAEAGAIDWMLVREGKHLVIDFTFTDRTIRQVVAATPSGPSGRRNEAAWLRRQARAKVFSHTTS
ncbi:hypothetical protein [Ensifer adhaerens]|uniref:hypothetical protein n=1 Tax=Ensifer adhaerens TaxID=106592 RepID=UPI00117826A6|nr:hypothetical protein [Ensifer adhaerens]